MVLPKCKTAGPKTCRLKNRAVNLNPEAYLPDFAGAETGAGFEPARTEWVWFERT